MDAGAHYGYRSPMREWTVELKIFISYPRENRVDIDQLVEHLEDLGCRPWFDSSIHGGQDWWQEILRQIENCDVFVTIVSEAGLNSVACQREFDWAAALGKSVLPVATEPIPAGLDRRIVSRQIVNYSVAAGRDRAALRLAAALMTLPPPQPRTGPPPEPPAAPLSYLTDLGERISLTAPLSQAEQRAVLDSLEPALQSPDPDERGGGRRILEKFSRRGDLFADVDRRAQDLKRLSGAENLGQSAGKPVLLDNPVQPLPEDEAHPVADQPAVDFRHANLAVPAVVIAIAAIAGAIPPLTTLSTNYDYAPAVWFSQDVSRILIGAAFGLLALRAESFADKTLMTCAYLMMPIAILQAIDHLVAHARRLSHDQVYQLATVFAYPALLALASLVAIAFGWTVFRAERLSWAAILTAWGACGLVLTVLSYLARVHDAIPPVADSVLVLQNFILLAAGILMWRESQATMRQLLVRQV